MSSATRSRCVPSGSSEEGADGGLAGDHFAGIGAEDDVPSHFELMTQGVAPLLTRQPQLFVHMAQGRLAEMEDPKTVTAGPGAPDTMATSRITGHRLQFIAKVASA